MKIITFLATLYLFLAISSAHSFEGYVKQPMHGNLLFPMRASDTELTELRIEIRRLGNYGFDTKVKTEYVLKNIRDEEIDLALAFPILSNYLGDMTQPPTDFMVSLNNKPQPISAAKMKLREYYLRLYDRLRPTVGKQEYLKRQGITDKDYDMSFLELHIPLKAKESITVVCEYALEIYLDPGVETLYFDFSPLNLWAKSPEKVSIRLALPEELIDHLKKPSSSKWPKVSVKPKAHKIMKDTLEWTYSIKTMKNIGYLWLDVDYRAPGMVGE